MMKYSALADVRIIGEAIGPPHTPTVQDWADGNGNFFHYCTSREHTHAVLKHRPVTFVGKKREKFQACFLYSGFDGNSPQCGIAIGRRLQNRRRQAGEGQG